MKCPKCSASVVVWESDNMWGTVCVRCLLETVTSLTSTLADMERRMKEMEGKIKPKQHPYPTTCLKCHRKVVFPNRFADWGGGMGHVWKCSECGYETWSIAADVPPKPPEPQTPSTASGSAGESWESIVKRKVFKPVEASPVSPHEDGGTPPVSGVATSKTVVVVEPPSSTQDNPLHLTGDESWEELWNRYWNYRGIAEESAKDIFFGCISILRERLKKAEAERDKACKLASDKGRRWKWTTLTISQMKDELAKSKAELAKRKEDEAALSKRVEELQHFLRQAEKGSQRNAIVNTNLVKRIRELETVIKDVAWTATNIGDNADALIAALKQKENK